MRFANVEETPQFLVHFWFPKTILSAKCTFGDAQVCAHSFCTESIAIVRPCFLHSFCAVTIFLFFLFNCQKNKNKKVEMMSVSKFANRLEQKLCNLDFCSLYATNLVLANFFTRTKQLCRLFAVFGHLSMVLETLDLHF